MDETLDLFSGKSGLRVGVEGIERPEPVAGQRTRSIRSAPRCRPLPRRRPGTYRGGRQGFVSIRAQDLSLDTARATRRAKVAAVFGFCTGSTRPTESLAHGVVD